MIKSAVLSIAILACYVSTAHAGWFAPPSKVARRAMEHALHAESMGQMEEALSSFAKARENYALALKTKPGWRGITLAYVMACVKTGHFHEAEEACRPLLEANRPIDVPMGYVLMAMAYTGLNDPANALAMLDAFPRSACLRTLTQEIDRIALSLRAGSMTTGDATGQLGAAIHAQGRESGNGFANPDSGTSDSGGTTIGGGGGATVGGGETPSAQGERGQSGD